MISTRLTPWTLKLLTLGLPSVFGAGAWWFLVQQALRGHVAFNQTPLLNVLLFFALGILSLGCWLAPMLLVAYVGPWRAVRWTAVAVAIIPVAIFFPLRVWTGLAAFILLVGFLWGMETMADDAHNRLTIQPMRTIPHAVPAIIFSVIVAISLLYYQQLRVGASTADALSRRLIEQTVTLTERIMPLVYRDYQAGKTVDELIGAQLPDAATLLRDIHFEALTDPATKQQVLNQKLADLGFQPNDLNLNLRLGQAELQRQLDIQLQAYHQQTIDQTRQELGSRLNVTLTGRETMHVVLTDIIGRQFDRYIRKYVGFVPILLALALFFILRIATSLFQAVVVWFGWLLLKLYRGLHVLAVTHQTVPAEKLDWKV